MKRILIAIALACAAVSSFGATLNPVQLLNPAGSSSGQAIISTGASTAPAWGNVPVANVTGAAALTGATFTGWVNISPGSGDGALVVNSVSGNTADVYLQTGGSTRWGLIRNNGTESGSNSGSNFQITRYTDAGTSIDNPLTITRSTGAVTMIDGITNTPVSATTISASGLITPTSSIGIKGTTAGDNAQAGSIGETMSATFTAVNMTTSGTAQSLGSIVLTAGDWDVTGYVMYTTGTGATLSIWIGGLNTVNNALSTIGNYFQSTGTIGPAAGASAIAPISRQNVTTNTTVYFIGEAVFSGGAVTATGFLRARRMR